MSLLDHWHSSTSLPWLLVIGMPPHHRRVSTSTLTLCSVTTGSSSSHFHLLCLIFLFLFSFHSLLLFYCSPFFFSCSLFLLTYIPFVYKKKMIERKSCHPNLWWIYQQNKTVCSCNDNLPINIYINNKNWNLSTNYANIFN